MTNRKTLTADQMTAKLARNAEVRRARALLRVQVGNELGLCPFSQACRREAGRRLKAYLAA